MKRHLLSAADLTLEDATLVLDTATELAQLTERATRLCLMSPTMAMCMPSSEPQRWRSV